MGFMRCECGYVDKLIVYSIMSNMIKCNGKVSHTGSKQRRCSFPQLFWFFHGSCFLLTFDSDPEVSLQNSDLHLDLCPVIVSWMEKRQRFSIICESTAVRRGTSRSVAI